MWHLPESQLGGVVSWISGCFLSGPHPRFAVVAKGPSLTPFSCHMYSAADRGGSLSCWHVLGWGRDLGSVGAGSGSAQVLYMGVPSGQTAEQTFRVSVSPPASPFAAEDGAEPPHGESPQSPSLSPCYYLPEGVLRTIQHPRTTWSVANLAPFKNVPYKKPGTWGRSPPLFGRGVFSPQSPC